MVFTLARGRRLGVPCVDLTILAQFVEDPRKFLARRLCNHLAYSLLSGETFLRKCSDRETHTQTRFPRGLPIFGFAASFGLV